MPSKIPTAMSNTLNSLDTLLRIFFSNFTITDTGKDFRKGSRVSYKLNEPYNGFVESGDFVLGALDALSFQHLLEWINLLTHYFPSQNNPSHHPS